MTKYIRAILLIVVTTPCFSQSHILSTINNVVYLDIGNSLSINLTEKVCKTISYVTDNGILEKQKCNVIYTPNRLGISTIQIFRFLNGKKTKVSESTFRVRRLPNPTARFAGRTGGKISAQEAKVNGGIICYVEVLDCWPTIAVGSYSIIIIKNNNSLMTTQNIGARFNDTSVDLMKKLEPGDTLIFSQIIVHMPDNIQKNVNPIEFIIE